MMCNRFSFAVLRSIRTSLSGQYNKYGHINRKFSIFAHKHNILPVFNHSYVMNCDKYHIGNEHLGIDQKMSQKYSTDDTQIVIPIVSYEEVKDLPNQPEKILIDVREPHELQETGQIPNAINIPLGEVNTALSMSDRQFRTKYNVNKPHFDDNIIFHCRSGKRSENAAITATKLGYTNVKNYLGSWLEWAEREGLPK